MLAIAALFAALLTVVASATANPSINSKRAQAQAVLAEIQQKNSTLEKAIEAYNLANDQLMRLEADLSSNARNLTVARRSLSVAQAHIADRLRALYVNGDSGGAVEIILGAESLDDLLNRLDAVQRVGDKDSRVLADVTAFRQEVQERRARLKTARAEQSRVVAERASHRRSVESQLRDLEQLRASIKDEIARLEAAERRRAAQLAEQARARLAAQLRAAQSARAERAEQSGGFSVFDAGTSASADPIAPPPPSQYGGVVGIAMQYLGIPYVWGGATPGGFDCSGFTQYVYSELGVSLPHNAAAQFGYGAPVSMSDLQPGDLVFFDGLGHVGIYAGGGLFVHSPHTGDVVKVSSLSGYYISNWVGARRL